METDREAPPVMTAYQINGPARQCAASGRELRPGERFFSVLLEGPEGFVRKDYAAEAWPGPPEGAVAFWSGRIPAIGRAARPTINDELLLDCFAHLGDSAEPAKRNFRYVVALLLMRRKRFKFEDARKRDGAEWLVLRDARSGARHEVPDPRLSEAEMASVQDEVFRVLGWA
jgi:hypothetical protein